MDFWCTMFFYFFIIMCGGFCHACQTDAQAATTSIDGTTIADTICACEPYFSCNQSDIFQKPPEVSCIEDDVYCCKPRGTTTTETTTDYISSISVSSLTESVGKKCTCVPAHECNLTREQKDTFGITIKSFYCGASQLCCPLNSIRPDMNSETTTTTTTEPPTDSKTSEVSTTERQANCKCVPTSKCRLTEGQRFKIGINIRMYDRRPVCKISEICCPPEKIVDDSLDCGVRNTAGEEFFHNANTSFGEFPWMALLILTKIDPITRNILGNDFIGGASLISAKFVLTGAHRLCDVEDVNLLRVRAGEYDTTAGNNVEHRPHQDRRVSKVMVHPEFNRNVLYNDLALLEVAEPFILDYHIKPICLPSVENIRKYDFENCVTTGWGKNAFSPDSPRATILKKMNSAIVSRDQCQQELRKTRLGPDFQLDSSFMCARAKLGMDACESDGGGPLVCPLKSHPNHYVQMGIVAWGINCDNGIPGVYASLMANLNWLTNATEYISAHGSSIILRTSLCPDIILEQV